MTSLAAQDYIQGQIYIEVVFNSFIEDTSMMPSTPSMQILHLFINFCRKVLANCANLSPSKILYCTV